jgi:hypothetical protein
MSLQGAQKGRPARPQRVKTQGVPLRYVEGLNDARTPLADFFSILLRFGLNQCPPLIADGEHDNSHNNHGQGKELAH